MGTDKDVTGDLSLKGADAGNYTVNASHTAKANITAKALTGSFTAQNKEYYATRDATVATKSLPGVISPDAVTLNVTNALFDTKDVGTDKDVTGDLSLSGTDAGNYTVNASHTAKADITAKPVTGSFTASNKVYDGNTDASVTNRSLNGTITGDTVSLSGGTASFGTKDVANGKTVTLSGASLAGSDAGNYNLTSVGTATADITAKELTGSFTAANKVYDGNTSATVDTRSLPGVISPDTVNLDVTNAQFDNKNVGNGKTVSADLALSGAQAGNYSLSSNTATTTADITAKELTGSFTANNKVYDGNTSATVDTRSLPGVISPDTVNLDVTNAQFDNKNVGNGKTVSADLALSGAQAGNYSLSSATATTTANITAKQLTGSFTADNKVYDGNASATVATKSLPGVISGDTVNLDVTNAQFDNKNVGNGKTVSADLALSGAQAGNYSLSSNTATTTADITAKELTGSFTASNKTYDGTTAATITGRSVSGKVGSDDVSLSGGSATFGTASAGTGKTVTATGFTLTGAAKDNYTLKAGPWTTTADINPALLTITADNKSKKLGDPNPAFTASYSGFVNGEGTSVLGGTLNFTTNVPNPEQVGAWEITPSGLTSSNYTIGFLKGTLTITYKFDGFRPPVDNPGTGATPIFNSAKAGQAIPIKFSLSGNQGLDIIAAGYPKVTSVNCTSSAVVDPLEEYAAVTANGGLNYDAGGNQYNYVWKTQSAYANKCFKFDLTLKDGTSHVAYFKFLK